ncbi:MAG: lamin tail domain-containing protein, partial [Bacteroidota bacterium]
KVSETGTYSAEAFSVNVAGLSEATTYYFKAFALNDSDTAFTTQESFTTVKPEPSNQPTAMLAMAGGTAQINLSWTDAENGSQAPDNYLILANTTNSFSNPVDETDPAEDTDMSDDEGSFKVAHGTQILAITGLIPDTQYYFKMWPYTNSGTNINFKTDGSIQTATTTTNATATACATDLIISEYLEGSSYNKYIEIYNGTSSAINLSDYKLQLYSNGSVTPSPDNTLSGTLDAGTSIVYMRSNATIYEGAATVLTAIDFNGDDAVALYKITKAGFVDIIGRIGEDPGAEWTSGLHSTLDKTLVRKASVNNGITISPGSGFPTLETEWDLFDTDDVSHLGSHTMSCGSSITLTTSTSSLTGFAYIEGFGPSSSQNYTISGTDLIGSGDITVTGSTNYEVSDDDSDFSSSITFPYASGVITDQPKSVYIRLKTSLSSGNYNNETITHTGGSAPAANVTVSGGVYKIEPTNQPTGLSATVSSSSQINLSWTDAATGSQSPDYYLIKAKTTAFVDPDDNPVDGTDPDADNNMGDGSGIFKVAHGVQSLNVLGLSASTHYYFKMWPYTNSGANINFKTDGTAPTCDATTNAASSICATDLIISEYYEGASNDKYVEIFNNTGSSVDLSNYKISIYFNGSTTASNIALSGTLDDGSVFIIAHSDADGAIQSAADQTSGSIAFNGDDAIALRNLDNDLIDVIGQIGNDPGTEWGSGLTSTADNTLVRISTITSGDTNGADSFDPSTEWNGYSNTTTYMGSHTMTCSIKEEPSNQPTSFSQGIVTSTAIPLTWSAAADGDQAPDGYLIKLNVGTIEDPVDGVDPANLTEATSGAANKKVTPGSATSTTSFTGMTAGTMYNYKIYSYTNSSANIDFNLSSPPSIYYATLPENITSPFISVTGSTTASISWTKPGSYSDENHSTLVFMKESSSITEGTPTDAPSGYTASSIFEAGTTYENDGSAFCIYNNDGNNVSVSGLDANTTYHVLIYTVVDAGNHNSTNSYSSGVTTSGTTAKAEPSNHPTDFASEIATSSAIELTWTDAIGSQLPDAYLIKLSKGGFDEIFSPVDGTAEADGDSTHNINYGEETYTFTGLNDSTIYFFKIYPYTNSGTNINYKTDGTPEEIKDTTNQSSGACPTELLISEYVEGSSNNKYIEIYNGTGSSIDLSDYKLQLFNNGGTSPNQNITLSGTLNDGEVVVYKNSLAVIYGGSTTDNAACSFNGDDAIALYKISSDSYVDIFGRIGEDPGSAWTDGSHT